MNKTININLAGLFFHIDEDAYNRLQRYLAAVRKSFSSTTGADEIMRDIESRVAELFLEKRANEMQVISIQHVEDVILIMGQPEDYEVDEDIFQENARPQPIYRPQRQLFRDTLTGYIGGVSSGLGHFLGMNAVWLRVLWIILLFATVGWIIPVYILFWILVPDAVTTAQRLAMQGKDINISNISGHNTDFNEVVTDETAAGYRIVGQKGKRGTVRFFGFIGRVLKTIGLVIAKVIGLLLFLTAIACLIALLVSVITASVTNVEGQNLITLFELVVPVEKSPWWFVVSIILAVGIPLFVLAILGLKLLVKNLKSIGMPAKLILLILWIAAIIGCSILIAQIAASQANRASFERSTTIENPVNTVLSIEMPDTYDEKHNTLIIQSDDMMIGESQGVLSRKLYKIKTVIEQSDDSTAVVKIKKKAKGSSTERALDHAQTIIYEFEEREGALKFPDFFILENDAMLNNQSLEIRIQLPVGTQFKTSDEFLKNYRRYLTDQNWSIDLKPGATYEVIDENIKCLDCPIENKSEIRLDDGSGEWKYYQTDD